MKYFIITNKYYKRLHNIDFSRLFSDIRNIGFKSLRNYGISTWDISLLLNLNYRLMLNKDLVYKFNCTYGPDRKYVIYDLKDWLETEEDSRDEIDLCYFKPYSTDFLLIIVNYNFFEELINDNRSTKWIDQILDYLYSNFGEELTINSELLKIKFYLKRFTNG